MSKLIFQHQQLFLRSIRSSHCKAFLQSYTFLPLFSIDEKFEMSKRTSSSTITSSKSKSEHVKECITLSSDVSDTENSRKKSFKRSKSQRNSAVDSQNNSKKPRNSRSNHKLSNSMSEYSYRANKYDLYRSFLLKNDDKFKQDINHMTRKKDKKVQNSITTFRPQLVKDYRHSSQVSSFHTASSSATSSTDRRRDSTPPPPGTEADDKFNFSVLSYNILADQLMKWHPELYTKSNKSDLVWWTRWDRIKTEIRNMKWPDIICLQEVQFRNPDHCQEHIIPFLKSHGYTSVFKNKTGDKVDGCLTAFKKDKFSLEETCPVEYKIDRVPVLDRDNVGLVVKLTPMNKQSAKPVIVANTHLLYNPKRGDIRLCQIALLLAEIDRIQAGEDIPVILTGDFNSEPKSHVVKLLESGSCQYAGVKLGRKAKRPAPVKLLPDSLGLSDTCQWHVSLEQRNLANRILSGSGAFSHSLGLKSVFDGTSKVTTYQDGWIMVDYMFYTGNNLRLRDKKELPSRDQLMNMRRIPNSDCPSDHLHLLAEFSVDK